MEKGNGAKTGSPPPVPFPQQLWAGGLGDPQLLGTSPASSSCPSPCPSQRPHFFTAVDAYLKRPLGVTLVAGAPAENPA